MNWDMPDLLEALGFDAADPPYHYARACYLALHGGAGTQQHVDLAREVCEEMDLQAPRLTIRGEQDGMYGTGDGDGNGNGDGYGDGYGNGNGDGDGNGYGNGNGYGYGDGNGYGNGNGYGHGDGYGDGYGNGNGNGRGWI